MKVPGKWLVNNDPDQAGVRGLVVWLPAACGFLLLSGHISKSPGLWLKMVSQLTFPSASGWEGRGRASLFLCEEAWSIGLLSFSGQVLVTSRCLFF